MSHRNKFSSKHWVFNGWLFLSQPCNKWHVYKDKETCAREPSLFVLWMVTVNIHMNINLSYTCLWRIQQYRCNNVPVELPSLSPIIKNAQIYIRVSWAKEQMGVMFFFAKLGHDMQTCLKVPLSWERWCDTSNETLVAMVIWTSSTIPHNASIIVG